MVFATKEESAVSRLDRLAGAPAPSAPPAPVAAPPADTFAAAATATVASETLRTGNLASRPAAESALVTAPEVASTPARRAEPTTPEIAAVTAKASAPAVAPTGETGVAGFAGGASPARQNAEATLPASDSAVRSRSFAPSSAAVEVTMTQRAQDYQRKLKVAAAVQNYNRAVPVAQKPGAGGAGALVASEVVLNRFQVANQDNLVSVVDADGSVYEGTLKEVVAEGQAEAQKQDLSAALPPRAEALAAVQNQAPVGQLYFEVVGTNISLGQRVVFTATVMPAASNALQVQNYLQNAPTLKDKAQNQLQNQILLQNSQLRGRVQLPQGQEFELEAVPTPP
jgi:hypothetical protein